jgi:hypothetical protein
VSGPFTIQRVPRGLSNLLSIFGGETPQKLQAEVQGALDLLQFYGLTQLQTISANNAALAENTGLIVTPSARQWCVLFAGQATFVKTATMTALWGELYVNRSAGSFMPIAAAALGPFGATETGTVGVGGFLPYPLLLPPGSSVLAQMGILGTDATANVSVACEFGLIG